MKRTIRCMCWNLARPEKTCDPSRRGRRYDSFETTRLRADMPINRPRNNEGDTPAFRSAGTRNSHRSCEPGSTDSTSSIRYPSESRQYARLVPAPAMDGRPASNQAREFRRSSVRGKTQASYSLQHLQSGTNHSGRCRKPPHHLFDDAGSIQ